MTDYVKWVLETLNNWRDSNYQPKPYLYHEEDKEYINLNLGERTKRKSFSDNNIISVGSQPTGSNEPLSFDFNYRVRAGVSVKIEAEHEDNNGHVANANEFKEELAAEAARCLHVERRWPIPDEGIYTLAIEEVDNQSTQWLNHYRLDWTVWFVGHQDLPAAPV